MEIILTDELKACLEALKNSDGALTTYPVLCVLEKIFKDYVGTVEKMKDMCYKGYIEDLTSTIKKGVKS